MKLRKMNISVIIPLFNEEESLQELCTLIDKVMQDNNFSYEVILIDDGSSDKTNKIIANRLDSNRDFTDLVTGNLTGSINISE